MKLIAFMGKARAGKDTAALRLVVKHGYHTVAFARPLKRGLQAMFGWDTRHTDGDLKELVDPQLGCTPRHAMQTLGTEWGRKCIADDLWIKLGLSTAQELLSAGVRGVVITDCRFKNEALAVRKAGGTIIRIHRDVAGASGAPHPSETELDTLPPEFFDWIIYNNDTIADFDAVLDQVMGSL